MAFVEMLIFLFIRISLQTRIDEVEKNLAVEQEAKEKVKIVFPESAIEVPHMVFPLFSPFPTECLGPSLREG